jgi:hypothetical protein
MTAPAIAFATDPAALQARIGARVAAVLSECSAELPHDINERLRVARDQAVARARLVRVAATVATPVGVSVQGTAVLGGFAPWWQRALSVVPLAVLVAGLLLANRWVVQEQMLDSAEIDSVLLADDLPPAAYTDPGFGEYLRSSAP